VGKFASAGIPRLDRLLRSGSFAVANQGQVQNVRINGDSFLEYADDAGRRIQLSFGRNTANSFCGLQIAAGRVFTFSDSDLKWLELKPVSLRLAFQLDTGEIQSFQSIAELSAKYKEIVII
jgi:hypothetical protein